MSERSDERGDDAYAIRPGDRVAAARDVETTQHLHIVEGAEGTVAEDRGSKLIVFFDDGAFATNLEEKDLRKLPEKDPEQ